MRALVALAALLALACAPRPVSSHAFLSIPAARNVIANSDYCPHCLNAGGVAAVSGGQAWPAGAHGLGGDPASAPRPRNHEAGGKHWLVGGGKPQATWAAGSAVDMTVFFSTYHRGRYQFRLCRIDGTSVAAETAQLTEACLEANVLRQAAGQQSPGDRWYHLGLDQNEGGTRTYTTKVQLPAGLTCDGVTARCVVQFHYMTGNSCAAPDEPAKYLGTANLQTCGAPGAPYPEEFWNLLDVKVVAAGSDPAAASPSPAASPPPVASPVPSPSPAASPKASPPPSPAPVPVPAPPPACTSASCLCKEASRAAAACEAAVQL